MPAAPQGSLGATATGVAASGLRTSLAWIIGLLLPCSLGLAAEPSAFLSLHPANPHYFRWRGNPTVLVTSGEHYGAVLNLDFDYVAYLQELQRHGLNHTRVFSGVYREDPSAFGITQNTLAPRAGRFICPWARSEQPGYHAGGNRFDLTKWDPAYFDRLKEFLTQAGKHGIVVELTLFCPMYRDEMWHDSPMHSGNNVNHLGDCGREEVYTGQHPELMQVQLAVTRKIVAELREFDNLYYEICNEPYFGGVTMPWQRAIADAIVEVEREFPQPHLISQNVANGRQKIEQPYPAVSIFNFHYCVPPDTVAMNYDLHKVIGENETGFRGPEDILYRTEAWDFLLAGGGLFNNLDYSFTAQHPRGTLRDYRSPGGGSVELRRQLGVVKQFLESFDFLRLQPSPHLIRRVTPELTASLLSEPGRAYAVYLHVPLPEKPKPLSDHLRDGIEASLELALPSGEYTVEWIDPETGNISRADRLDHASSTAELKSPRFNNDIAIRLKRVK